MKKGISIVLVFCLFATMALGSGSNNSNESTKNINEVVSDLEEASEEIEDVLEEVADATDEMTEEVSVGETTIEEAVVYDQDGIVITAVEYEVDSFWGDSIKFLIENNTEKNLSVTTDAVIVDDYMVTDLFYADVAAGKKSNESLTLSSSALEAAGISKIGKVEVYFSVSDADTYDNVCETGCIEIETNLVDSMDEKVDEEGTVLYEDGDIKIIGKYVDESSFWGAAVMLYIENNTDKNIVVSAEDLSVNGFMVTSFLYQTVYANKMAYEAITLFESDLEENGIEAIDEIALKFDIHEDDTFSSIATTDEITFSVSQ